MDNTRRKQPLESINKSPIRSKEDLSNIKTSKKQPFKYALALAKARVHAHTKNLPSPSIKILMENKHYVDFRPGVTDESELISRKERVLKERKKREILIKRLAEKVEMGDRKNQNEEGHKEEEIIKFNELAMENYDLYKNDKKKKLKHTKIAGSEDKKVFKCLGCNKEYFNKTVFNVHRDSECKIRNKETIQKMMQISGVKKVGKDNISCYCRDNNEMGNTPLVQCDWCLCWLHYSCLLRSGDIPGWNESLHPNVNLNYEVPVEPPHQLYCKRCVYLVTEFERDQKDYKDEIVLQENINSKRTGDQRKFKKILPKKKSSVLEKQLLQRAALNFQALGREVLDEENLELGNSNSEVDNGVLENGIKDKFTKIVPRKDVKQIKAYSPNQEQIKGIENGKLIEHKIRKNLSSNNASKNHNISKLYTTQTNAKSQRNSDANINSSSQLMNDQSVRVNAQGSINDKLSEHYTKINPNKYLNKIINNPEVLNNDTIKTKGSLDNLKDDLVINNVSKQKEVVNKERQTRSNKKK